MKKKMTLKEFKRVLKEVAHMPLDTWGYDGLLNTICLARRYCANNAEQFGCENAAKRDREIASDITNYLLHNGYYD